ncbi:MAG: [FeFe] hydrogenase H-cluster radical SAM maturase HydE [Bacteroidales bacterium]|nr:[FeFe] hydrogenase H-cluster radical SAM maturase HydE [Bacteroidales bacterium]
MLLLQSDDAVDCAFLQSEARKASVSVFGNSVYIRGLVEISNHCRNNCFYCGIRSGNPSVARYRLDKDEILECCARGHSLGFRTFVLQGGEDPAQTDDWVEDVVRSIRAGFPDCAITLSLGEKPAESYRRFKAAGADRYLLRHETFNKEHYLKLHPASMSRERRLGCLSDLKELGYQTGSGFMVGSPFQSLDNIVEDILFIQDLQPEMIGIGPFIHHPDTPFSDSPDGSVSLTLKLISIFRLINPQALIPATTSLATLDAGARGKGILSGANVVMPNLTPASRRRDYSLYEGKAAFGAESAEGLEELRKEMKAIGYEVVVGRGDYGDSRLIN